MQPNKGHMNPNRFWKKGALIILLAALAIGLWSPPVHAAVKQTISKVDIINSADAVVIKATASAPLALYDTRLGARYIVLDLYGTIAASQRRRVNINSGGVRFINCAGYKDSPPIARIAVATGSLMKYSIEYENGKKLAIITIDKYNRTSGKTQMAVKASKQTSTVPVTASPSKAIQAEVQAQPALEPVQMAESEPAAMPVAEAKPVLVASTSPILPRTHTAPKPVIQRKPILVASALPEVPKQKLVSLDFVASDIHDVLKALSTQGGVNIVASADVKGEVTASLNKVSVEDALKLVANLSGFRYEQRDGVYVVGTAENLKSLAGSSSANEEKVTAVAILAYSDPALVTKMLEAQYGMVNVTSSAANAKKDAPQGQTVLVLNGPADAVDSAKAMVQAIEDSVAANSAGSVTELYEVKYADIGELQSLLATMLKGLQVSIGPNQGFNLQCPEAIAMGSEGTSTSPTNSKITEQVAPPKVLILQGSQEDVDKAKEFLAKVDVPQQQILIEAKVIDVNDDASKDLGIDWGDQGVFSEQTISETPDSGLNIGRFTRTGLNIMTRIRALIQDKKGKVLANPNVLALDGKPSSIFIGDEVKYVINVDHTLQGTTVSTETARVGVQLHTISRVSSDGYITMDLHPEVSVITSFLDTPAGLSLPQISRRFIDSTVRVKDGETIVIGGLVKDDDIKTVSGIPLLKDLPIIGQLFRSKSTSKIHSEVMMFITPKLVTDP
ncbi:MAG TPA: secretin and TonB N-terminal domain-containing protein [Armatimonadota bacterium]|nr:secretin and TonB N-terminal domain-containing protein [Armatimonadota bacterium]